MPTYRGKGGAEFEITPPAEGSEARERFDAQLDSGDLVLVEAPPTAAKPAAKPAKPAAADAATVHPIK